ncbi:MAG: PCMD domain-containing protein, partial [Muribaculaceae bacterium]|nr:PCMD domain-containing protein [Muribaculaceae bacterium]
VIVCSASKFGDYFCGSSSSVMYVDDFELVYE